MLQTKLGRVKRAKRRNIMLAACSFLLLNACEAKDMRVVLDLVLFNYLDRPIFAVNVDGIGYEVSEPYPKTGKSTTTGFALTLGPKIVTWQLDGPRGAPRNGEIVQNKNALELTKSQIAPGAKFISVHVYPDDNVELVTSAHFPRATARGEREAAEVEDRHGK